MKGLIIKFMGGNNKEAVWKTVSRERKDWCKHASIREKEYGKKRTDWENLYRQQKQ